MSALNSPCHAIRFPLDRLFPDGYFPVDSLEHLIVTGAPLQSKVEWLQSHPKVNFNTSYDSFHRITVVGIAVLFEDVATFELLKSRDAPLFPLDSFGWTPLHYLQITGNTKLHKMLKARAKTEGVKLFEFIQLLRPEGMTKYTISAQVKGKKTSINAEQFRAYTNVEYRETPYADPKAILAFWEKTYVEDCSCSAPEWWSKDQASHCECEGAKKAIEVYRNSLETPVKLSLVAPTKNNGPGVVADEFLTPSMCLGALGGEIVPGHPPLTTKYGNLLSFVQDGYPNCRIEVVNVHGIPYHLLFPNRTITAGEHLKIDHGVTHPRKQYQNQSQLESVGMYKKECAIDAYYELIKARNPQDGSITTKSRIRFLEAHLNFLFNSHFLLIDLLLREIIDSEELLQVLTDDEFCSTMKWAKDDVRLLANRALVVNWDHIWLTAPDEIYDVIRAHTQNYVKTHTALEVLGYLQALSESISSIKTRDDWIRYTNNRNADEQLTKWLATMEEEDECIRVMQLLSKADQEKMFAVFYKIVPTSKSDLDYIQQVLQLSDWLKGNLKDSEITLDLDREKAERFWLYNQFAMKANHPTKLADYNKLFRPIST